MKFSDFAKYLSKLETTSARLEMTEILKSLILELHEKEKKNNQGDVQQTSELQKAVYLSLGYLAATFENPKFSIAEKTMIKAISRSLSVSEKEIEDIYNKEGDLGNVFSFIEIKNESMNMNIVQVHHELLKIAEYSGSGSQEDKVMRLSELLKKLDPLSAKFVVRIVLGITRLGFTELTILDALSKTHTINNEGVNAETKTTTQIKQTQKEIKALLETKYNAHPDIGLITQVYMDEGVQGLSKINIVPGVPVLPQKAQRIGSMQEIIQKMGAIWGEYKFDGTRVRLHIDKNKEVESTKTEQKNLFEVGSKRTLYKTFTRNLEDTTYQYPDIITAAEKQVKATSVILDGEAIGYDKKTGEFLPFQQIMQRKRKHNVQEMAEQVPLKYFVFDILYLNGIDQTNKTLEERKKILKEIIEVGDVLIVDEHEEISNLSQLEAYFENARDKGLEGLILKKPDAPYKAGARDFTWVKLKVADTKLLDDSIDCVILGYYYGKGVRTKFGIGGFLAGVYDPNELRYKTITKVGTGLTDEDWIELKALAEKHEVSQKPKNVDIDKIYNPDVWLNPNIVVELGADEVSISSTHSAGYALRFPRLIKIRYDRKAEQSTTVEEVADLHNMQKKAYY